MNQGARDPDQPDQPEHESGGDPAWEDLDDDARFERIVAGLREESPSDPADAPTETPETAVVEPAGPTETSDPVAALPSQWRVSGQDAADLLPPESHEYQPPEPEPLPAGDLGFWGALLGTIGGPLFLLYLVFFDRDARPLTWFLGGAVTVAGLVLIVLRQPERRSDDWDDDVDGAVL